jgi:hypothetical protein
VTHLELCPVPRRGVSAAVQAVATRPSMEGGLLHRAAEKEPNVSLIIKFILNYVYTVSWS